MKFSKPFLSLPTMHLQGRSSIITSHDLLKLVNAQCVVVNNVLNLHSILLLLMNMTFSRTVKAHTTLSGNCQNEPIFSVSYYLQCSVEYSFQIILLVTVRVQISEINHHEIKIFNVFVHWR